MTSDVEEILRDGLTQLTAGAKPPAGLVGRARRRNRQRRIAIRAAAATGTAAVAAIAAIAVTGATPRTGGAPSGQTTAYVTNRAEQALAALPQGKLIEVEHDVAYRDLFGFIVLNMALSQQADPSGPAQLPGVLGGVHAQQMVTWTYQGLTLQEGFTAAGKPVFNATIGMVRSAAGTTVLEAYGAAYPARARWRSPVVGANMPAPALTCGNAVAANSDWKAGLLKALSCKLFVLTGRQQVNGIDALELTLKPQPGAGIRETLWIDPSTYLPLRKTTTLPPSLGNGGQRVSHYEWLLPTQANLAALHAAIRQATIPAGFRPLPPTDLPLPVFGPPSG